MSLTVTDPLQALIDLLERVICTKAESLPLHLKAEEPSVLHSQPLEQIKETLCKVQRALRKNDRCLGSPIADYLYVEQYLKKLGVPCTRNRLFQADVVATSQNHCVDRRLAYKALRGLEALSRLHIPQANSPLDRFKKDFIDRYEYRSMPLAVVLDPEMGIGYADTAQFASCTPFLEELTPTSAPDSAETLHWSNKEDFLLQKYLESASKASNAVHLTFEELSAFTPLPDEKIPVTLAVLTTLLDPIKTKASMYVQTTLGAVGSAVLSRFCDMDAPISNLALNISKAHALESHDVVQAEIMHLPYERAANFLLRPGLSAYEIPYLTRSGRDDAHQISLEDLWVQVNTKSEIILWSAQLKKRIRPVAHHLDNFRQNSNLPLYYFLNDLQYEHAARLHFSWGALEDRCSFLPRVMLEDIILHRATWQLKPEQYATLLKAQGSQVLQAVHTWRIQHRVPRFVAMMEFDREQSVDLENPDHIDMFCSELGRKPALKLVEALHHPQHALASGPKGSFAQQSIFFFHKKNHQDIQASASAPKTWNHPNPCAVQNTFVPGSAWLCYKFYCGVQTADRLLIEGITPLAQRLLDAQHIDRWFFIRYQDPDPHLRVRFHLTDTKHLSACMEQVHHLTQGKSFKDLIQKTQVDQYTREVERYGGASVACAEALFFYDSLAVTRCITDGEEDDARFVYGACATDAFLEDCRYTLSEKTVCSRPSRTSLAKNSFATRHSVDSSAPYIASTKTAYKQRWQRIKTQTPKTPFPPRCATEACKIEALLMLFWNNIARES